MTVDEFLSLLKWLDGIGITTLGQAQWLFEIVGAKTNNEKLNAANELFCKGFRVKAE